MTKSVSQTISQPDKGRLLRAIGKLTLEPPSGDIKPLVDVPNALRLRVGKWRLVIEPQADNVFLIQRIDSRGSIYKGV